MKCSYPGTQFADGKCPPCFAVCHVITLDAMNVYNSVGIVYVVAYEWDATFYSKFVEMYLLYIST